MFYKILLKESKGSVRIETDIDYDYVEVFHNPEIIQNALFKVYRGNKKMDVIGYCETVNFAISEKFKNVLENNVIKGWKTYVINIEGFEDNQYFGFQVIGKGGEVTNRDKYGDVPISKSIKWNKDKWDGSDIFYLEDTLIKVCTERVKEIIEKIGITNICFEPL